MVLSIVVLALNVFIPGIGTIVMGCVGKPISKTQIVIGIIQFLCAFYILGWIWAIAWGGLVMWKFIKKKKEQDQPGSMM